MGSFNGNGTFVRSYSWVNDAANGIDITASRTDTEDDGFAGGLSICITRDGQGAPTAPINWGNQNLYNVNTLSVSLINISGDINAHTGTFTADVTAANLNIPLGNKVRFGDNNFYAQIIGNARRINFNSGQWIQVDIVTNKLSYGFGDVVMFSVDSVGNAVFRGTVTTGTPTT